MDGRLSLTPYEKVKAWRKANPDKVAAQARRWRAKHPDKAKEIKARYRKSDPERIRLMDTDGARRRRAADPEGNRRRMAAWLIRQAAKREAEAGRPKPDTCELCGEMNGRIVFDHCHTHGHFRGWLCDRCNKVLGLMKDSPALLRKLADYLEKTSGETDGCETK